MTDDVSIIIGGRSLQGWQSVRITRGCERVPASFELMATERYPDQIGEVAIAAGNPCQVKIGPDTVITGYVDRVMPSISPHGHSVRIQGRSKMEDIVDCSVTPDVITGMQIRTSNLLELATRIAGFYGIPVKSLTGDNVPVSGGGTTAPYNSPLIFNVVLSETGYEIIERVARWAQVLVYDEPDGSMVLARAGASTMASGFQQGVNIQEASAAFSMDQRYSEYLPMLMSYKFFGSDTGSDALTPVYDKSVPRKRQLVIISEQFDGNGFYAQQRAKWEEARRIGRSQAVRIVCDSWRDSSGALWQPNAFVPQLNIPAIKVAPVDPWVISDVTFSRDLDRGTTAELTLMPKQAFVQEPIVLLPFLGYWPDGKRQGAGVPSPAALVQSDLLGPQ